MSLSFKTTFTPQPLPVPVTVPDAVNPDCTQGKHRACAGDAWDAVRDELPATVLWVPDTEGSES